MKNLLSFITAVFVVTNVFSQVSFTVDQTQGCSPLTVQFTNTSSIGTTYVWDFFDGTTYNGYETTHTFTSTGDYWVNLSAYDSFGNHLGSYQAQIIVFGADTFSCSLGNEICPGEEARFSFMYDYNWMTWDFGDGTTAYDNWVNHTFTTPGTYDVTLIVETQCGTDTVIQQYTVSNTAVPSVEIFADNTQICQGDQVAFWSQYNASAYLWDFDDGFTSTLKNPVHNFTTLGSKAVTLTVTNMCGNTNSATTYINVTDNLEAFAQFGYDAPACPNGLISFYGQYYGTYLWDFGVAGSSTLRNPNVLFTDTGTYPVQVIFTNGCGDTDTTIQDITIAFDTTNIPQASIEFDIHNNYNSDTIQICPGAEIKFKNKTWSSGDLYFLWNFNDGNYSYSKDAFHSFSTPGIYEVVMTATNNCNGKDSASLWVIVDPATMPNANLMALPDTICPGESAFFWDDNTDIDDEQNNYLYSILFGDGDSLINATSTPDSMPFFHHQYNYPGSYNYLFTVTNMCGNSEYISNTIIVDSTGNHESFYFYASSADTSNSANISDQLPCPGDIIEFWAVGGISTIWDFGDGTIDTGMHVFHSFPDTGNYTVYLQVTDGCGNIDTLSMVATVIDSSFSTPWFDVSREYACANDTIDFMYANEGISTYSYSFYWDFDDGTTSTQRNPRHAYASAGEYFVKLIVTNGCGSDSSMRMIIIDEPNIDFTVDQNIIPPNTTVNFTNLSTNAVDYLWYFGDGDTSSVQNPSHTYTNFGGFNVTLYALSSVGCTSSVSKPNYIHVHNMQIAQAYINNVSCNGLGNGSIDISVSGGQFPYTYQWSNGGTSQHIQNLSPGTYSVTVTDMFGAEIISSFTITQPQAITANINVTNASCFNSQDGAINLNTSGGTVPYDYLWSNGATTQNINNLSAGTYYFTVTDSNGCIKSDSVLINSPAELVLYETTSTYPSSCGTNDGSISVDAYGGTGAYTFNWDANAGGITGQVATNLQAGAYYVTVTDISGCQDIELFSIFDMTSSVNINQLAYDNISCYGNADGWIYVSASGTPPLSYLWSTGSTDTAITNLAAGDYYLEIVDGANCSHFTTFTIDEPQPLNAYITKTDPTCYGSYNGYAEVHPSGGTSWSNYYYQWSNGSTNQYIINRPAGTYTVTVTDDQNCTTTASITLENPPQIQIYTYPNDVNFHGNSDGYMDIIVTNATPPLSYSWSNGATTEDIGGLSAGIYSVFLTDANSCTASASDTINEPPMLDVNILTSGDTVFCLGNNVTLYAGPGYVSYQWSSNANNATTPTVVVNTTGTYYVTVTSPNSYGIGSIYVDVKEPYASQEICIVTIDSTTNKNLVVWEKPANAGIESFNIYKESTYSGIYDLVGNVPYDNMSEFIDSTSNPSTVSARYKISVIDTCGNESALSAAHKTMHLTVSTGIGVYNLIWENYEGFTFGSYTIYRGDNPNNLLPIGAIQSTLTSYTDYQPIGLYYYQISVEKTDPCIPTSSAKAAGGPYSHSVSNLEDNGIATGIEQMFLSDELLIYPNPFINSTTVKFNNRNNSNYTLRLYDVSGKEIRCIKDITTNIIVLEKDNLPAGFYTIELKGEKLLRGRVIVK